MTNSSHESIRKAVASLSNCTTPQEYYSLLSAIKLNMPESEQVELDRLSNQIEISKSFTSADPATLLRKAISELAKKYGSLDTVAQKQQIHSLVNLSKSCGISMTSAELRTAVRKESNDLARESNKVKSATASASTTTFIKVSHKAYAQAVGTGLLTKYVPEVKSFITYSQTQQKWTFNNDGKEFTDKLHAVINEQTQMVSELPMCETRDKLLEDLEKTESANFIRDVVQYSKSLPEFSLRMSDLDKNKSLLNCMNGAFNLDTYELVPSDPDYLLTQCLNTRFDANATCPTWEDTLKDIHGYDHATIEYLQKYLGYALLGNPIEKQMLILHGSRGNNGKSLITGTLLQLLGDYGVSARPSIICVPPGSTEGANTGHNTEIMKLAKKRLINFNEAVGQFRQATVKQLVGDLGAGMSVREIHGREQTLYIEGAVIVDTNSVPGIPSNDEATWRRLQVIPYTKYYIKATDTPEVQEQELARGNKFEDVHLSSKLKDEFPGILNWLIAGLKKYRAEGIVPTRAMVEAKSKLRTDRDPLQVWLAQTLKPTTKANAVSRKDLWTEWQSYEVSQSTQIFRSSATFYAALEQKGIEISKYNGEWVIKEKAIRTPSEKSAYIAEMKQKEKLKDQLDLNLQTTK